tara:strand:- start:18809 stop:19021 length:213 start_codon:yes stop_codon:yes gene_type:complete
MTTELEKINTVLHRDNCKMMSEKIRTVKTLDEAGRIDVVLTRLYDADMLTSNQYSKLYVMLLDKRIKIES